jgi:hypothetical protein
MYDSGKIIAGLLIFFALLSFPFWYTLASGKAGYEPVLEKAAKGDTCVMDPQEMKSEHMTLLNKWRDLVVREGVRVWETEEGVQYQMSLTNTCLDCHESKEKFCDQCHNYLGVDPFCWECHIDPETVEDN